MNINIDSIIEHLAPWELTIQIGELEYATRPPTLGEMMALGEASDISQVKGVLGRLFVGSPHPSPLPQAGEGKGVPDLDALSTDQLMAIAVAIGQYAGERSKKNGPAMARAINREISPMPGRS